MMIGVRDAVRRHAFETTTSRCRKIPTLQPSLRSPLLIQMYDTVSYLFVKIGLELRESKLARGVMTPPQTATL